MSGPGGFKENPQTSIAAGDDAQGKIDEGIWGSQKVLTPEEQVAYDAWFRKRVGKTLQKIHSGTAEFKPHAEVVAEMRAFLDQLDREAGIRDN